MFFLWMRTWILLIWKRIADEIGIYFDESINNRLRGVSRMASLDIILERAERRYSVGERETLAEKKNQIYIELLQQMSTSDLSDEVKETLERLHLKGYKLAIGSSSKNAKKPNPEVFLKAAEYLNFAPHDCLVVEDAFAGIAAAVSGGFDSAGIGEAATHEKVTYPIKRFQQLLDI